MLSEHNPVEQQKILIVDDSEMNRSLLSDMLGEEFEIIEAADGVEAISLIEEYETELSLVLLDINMPRMDGFEVLAIMNDRHWIQDIPVIIISAENFSDYVERAYELGVTDYIQRPFDALVVRRRSLNTMMLYGKQKTLKFLVEEQIRKREKEQTLLVNILSHIVEFRNRESGQHVLNIRIITDIILRNLAGFTNKYKLTQEEIALITMASSLHDIGKIAIDEAILNKPGRFTSEEFAIMKTHTTHGAAMLDALPFNKNEPLVRIAREICLSHHERWNGRGYPNGLKGDEIPISAQVVSLADVYDALTSERVYKKSYSHEVAIDMITSGECGEFNPVLIEVLNFISNTLQTRLKLGMVERADDLQMVADGMVSAVDISASRRTLELLDRERDKYRFITALSKEILFELLPGGRSIHFFDGSVHEFGVDEFVQDGLTDEAMARCFGKETLHEIANLVIEATKDNPIVEYECDVNRGGEGCRYKLTILKQFAWNDDKGEYVYAGAIGKMEDITASHIELTALKYASTHDALTGILNRAQIQTLAKRCLAQNRNKNYVLAVIDVDDFKTINDTFGHQFGDEVLKNISSAIKNAIPASGYSARIGGDEFLAFWEESENTETEVKNLFEALEDSFRPIGVGSASIGVALTDSEEREYEKLFKCADTALYTIKYGGKHGYRFFNSDMNMEVLTLKNNRKDEEE